MIFYDPTQRRKYIFRSAAALLGAAFFVLAASFTFYFLQPLSFFKKPASVTIESAEPDTVYKSYIGANKDLKWHYGERVAVFTFDDGPHPVYTREVMDILKKHGVPATFFFVGKQMLEEPELVREVYGAGFEIGNHTFSHAHSVNHSPRRLRWELDATNAVLEIIIGRHSTLYRPPFLIDTDPPSIFVANADGETQILGGDSGLPAPIKWVEEYGYTAVGIDVDSLDWEAESVSEITDRVLMQRDSGPVILLHDGGGDARHTPAALEEIILRYKTEGYRFLSVGEFLGLPLSDTMPITPPPPPLEANLAPASLSFYDWLMPLLRVVGGITLILAIGRTLFVLLLYGMERFGTRFEGLGIHRLRDTSLCSHGLSGEAVCKVSVIIPAYNESANIASTVQSVLDNSYRPSEIIVVDDGSDDGTADVVASFEKNYSGLVRLVRKENGGKASALNLGIQFSNYEIIVALDADTIFDKDAIYNLAKHFSDSRVGAVAGKIYAIQNGRLLPAFQGVEYIVGQNLEKRALGIINSIGVVPGAVGAWRRSEIASCGGYSHDTLVEDQDLTLAILERGKRVIFEPKAIAYTEVPRTLRAFMRQRFRWVFGSLQCFWKYKRYLFGRGSGGLGWIVLPNIAIYHFLAPLFLPMVDGMFLLSFLTGSWQEELLRSFVLFTALDIFYACIAFWEEGKKEKKLLFSIPLQRLYYREMIYITVLRCFMRALDGGQALWKKLPRAGDAERMWASIKSSQSADSRAV